MILHQFPVFELITLITRRSEVRILPPLLEPSFSARRRGFFFVYSGMHFLIPVYNRSMSSSQKYDEATGRPVKRRFQRDRSVRLHASGRWICTIGRVWSTKKAKLIDKDWYFNGTQADAVAGANARARQWELLCRNWERTERSALEILGEPVPHEPRWPSKSATPKSTMTAQDDDRSRRDGNVDFEEMTGALAEFSFEELIVQYSADRRKDVNEEQVELSTLAKEVSQMRQVAKFLPSDIPGVELRAEHFRSAKSRMLSKFKRRTVRNYLSAGTQLLRWLWGRYGGEETRIPGGIEDAISLRNSTNLDIRVYSVAELKVLVEKTRGTISQMDLMLALNCGMYQEDIGRLRLDEIDLKEGSVFWDREKEPGNPFRIHHLLWPETLVLVKRFLNDGTVDEAYIDYRIREGKPTKVKTRDLAFLHKNRPRYVIKPSGSAYDLVGRKWCAIKTGAEFRNIRKSTSELLTSLAEAVKNPEERADVVDIVQQRFLGQKTPQLMRLYRTIGKGAYSLMNQYLPLVGDKLRTSGVFKMLSC
jgi:integrase